MKRSLIFVPERLAGYPLTLNEAVRHLGLSPYSSRRLVTLTVDDRLRASHDAWGSIWCSLNVGELHSFIQSPTDGSWRRLPREYWAKDYSLGQPMPAHPLESVEASAYVDIPSELIGGLIVVWREDIDKIVRRIDEMAVEMLEEMKASEAKEGAASLASSGSPEDQAGSCGPPQATSGAVNRGVKWLQEQFVNPGTQAWSKEDFQRRAAIEVIGLTSGRSFRNAWSRATADHPERRKSGPKKPKD